MWRSLDELAGDPRVMALARREFPSLLDRLVDAPSRREFLRLMGASLALAGLEGCIRQPEEKIVPYVRAPEQIIPGKPLYYATAMTHGGASLGLLVESQMGRPVKVEGNPLHPAVPEVMSKANDATKSSLRFGATDAFAQAIVLSLYDPDRSQTVIHAGQIDTWESFYTQLRERLEKDTTTGGAGLRVLSEAVISPTLVDQIEALLKRFPGAKWHQYEPINEDAAIAGARLAFGASIVPSYDLAQADVILSLDADFLVDGPQRLVDGRAFAERRKVGGANAGSMNRLYMVETGRTQTGAVADHRLAVGPREVIQFTWAIAAAFGLQSAKSRFSEVIGVSQSWIDVVVGDLRKSRGRSVVLAGRMQPPVVHALAHWLNQALGNIGTTVTYRDPIVARAELNSESMRELTEGVRAGEVSTLIMLGGNPAYNAPAELKFGEVLAGVPFTVHLSEYVDETSAQCGWHIPAAHLLESWSDTRAADSTASIVQPLIAPLYGGKTSHELVAALLGDPDAKSHDLVRGYWERWHQRRGASDSFDAIWRTALHDGVVAGTQMPPVIRTLRPDIANALEHELDAINELPNAELQIAFRPDPSVWDGRFANNGWLQELPRPFSKLTWNNAVLVSPATAAEHSLKSGDVVEIVISSGSVKLPVVVVPGHPRQTVTVHIGYGRTAAGRIGNSVGVNIYPLRTSDAPWFAGIDRLKKTGTRVNLATTQHHHLLEGRNLIRTGTLAEFVAAPQHPKFMDVDEDTNPQESLYPQREWAGYQWGMVVNQSACFGCNACVVACQAENNVPIVGADQVSRGREMHWLRIDNYYDGSPDDPETYHQPMLCMHCEMAPCEVVCPVAATTHSDEGLNEMTYNRCVGTRYCSNNCPYKVRRFNFFDYNAELRENATMQLRPNPDVTVRSRGVMEKCTYCVQRINEARITTEKQDRTIHDGEIVTACQAACPAEALTFGNLNEATSAVAQLAKSSLNYSVLGELNTRPRTTHLAVVRNPNPALRHTSDESTT
ncbi:MAG TPA: TAT-variant-translocated molybdopterin oxidoreductase [Lacipirellulaceae bacterium]|jgi:molybdopterin-containing oxidoreductase family iron-sulfur binding subunit